MPALTCSTYICLLVGLSKVRPPNGSLIWTRLKCGIPKILPCQILEIHIIKTCFWCLDQVSSFLVIIMHLFKSRYTYFLLWSKYSLQSFLGVKTLYLGSKYGLQCFCWGQNLAYDTFLGVKVQFSKLSLVQSLLYKFSPWGQSTVCNVFHGVKVGLDHSSGSELLVHFRAQDVL